MLPMALLAVRLREGCKGAVVLQIWRGMQVAEEVGGVEDLEFEGVGVREVWNYG